MHIHESANAGCFHAKVQGFLLQQEAENNLMLGILGELSRPGSAEVIPPDPPVLCCAEEEGKVVAVAVRTPPHHLVLTRGPAVAMAMLADHLARRHQLPTGVLGPTDACRLFMLAWGKLSRQKVGIVRALRVYEARDVVRPPTPVAGRLELAARADFDLLLRWAKAFNAEIHEGIPADEVRMVEAMLAEQRLFVWKDERPVAMAACAGPTPNGIRVNLVYTPPALRGRGYATSAVAALTQRLLDAGRKSCFLFTDLSNPTSNRIYQRIGYRPVCDFEDCILT